MWSWALWLCQNPSLRGTSGRFSLKLMIESWSSPPQSAIAHRRPVLWSCTFVTWCWDTSKSRRYWRSHLRQISKLVFPCNSANFQISIIQQFRNFTFSGCTPLFLWRPSIFWLIINWHRLLSSKLTKLMWVVVGRAFNKGVVGSVRSSPLAARVQTPWGPLKSGIPALVEIPAPVKKTVCLDERMRSATSFALIWSKSHFQREFITFFSIEISSSVTSLRVSGFLWAVQAICIYTCRVMFWMINYCVRCSAQRILLEKNLTSLGHCP